jgi:hypothetical protein
MRVQIAIAAACAALAACQPARIDRSFAECQLEAKRQPAPSTEAAAQLGMVSCMEAWGYRWKLTPDCTRRYLTTKDASCYERDDAKTVGVEPP